MGRTQERPHKETSPEYSKNGLSCGSNTLHRQKRSTPSHLHLFHYLHVDMVQHDLIHQFKDLGYMDISFASWMTQVLYMGEFLYTDSSTLSNFTIFAFHKQEPNSNKLQNNYLICHLLQVEGQKKSLDKIKASLKQSVNIE
jgi:hypothetical protein